MKFKITVADPETRKTYQKEVDQGQSGLLGKKIGEEFSGDNIGLNGYSLKITGGSDRQGFPMRRDVEGTGRRRILLSHPPGYHPQRRGQRKRKGVRGNTISKDIIQVNAKVVKRGKKKLKDLLGKEKEKPKEKGKKEKPKKEKPEEKEGKEKPKKK